jgi:DNA ligase-1
MMLANRWTGQPVGGWWLSEKLDGCRAFWDRECFRTKDSWLRIDAPKWLTDRMPRDRAMDGELWGGYGTFQAVRVLVQYQRAADEAWRGVRFMCFDAPTTDAIPVERRWLEARALAEEAGCGWVEQRRCIGAQDAQMSMERIVAAGGEGVVLRRPGHCYEFGRSSAWLKVKPAHVD